MNTVGDVLRRKARPGVVACSADDTVLEAISRMDDSNTGAVVVLDARSRLAGIFTERDLMRRVVLRDRDPRMTRVAAVMTRELVMTTDDEPTEVAMAKMTTHRCRHLPVVTEDRLTGVLSIGDLLKELVDRQSDEISVLKTFIASS